MGSWLWIWHAVFGHPRKNVVWGSFENGAVCHCGTIFHYWDLIP